MHMMRVGSLLPLVLLIAAAPVPLVGLGASSCSIAMQPGNDKRSFDYILGVWDGLGMASGRSVTRTPDPRTILNEVVTTCAGSPTLPLADAVLAVRARLQPEAR